jgi:hypothetical protein
MALDRKAIETSLASGLPVQARWMINGTPLDFEFAIGRLGLRRLPDEVLETDAASSDLLAFGEQDFAEGGGARPWLCVRERDGWILGFDPEREEPMFLLNSSVECFVATFRLLNDCLARNKPLPPDGERRLRAIDPEAYPNSDWRLLVECLRSSEPDAPADGGRTPGSSEDHGAQRGRRC